MQNTYSTELSDLSVLKASMDLSKSSSTRMIKEFNHTTEQLNQPEGFKVVSVSQGRPCQNITIMETASLPPRFAVLNIATFSSWSTYFYSSLREFLQVSHTLIFYQLRTVHILVQINVTVLSITVIS